ncbi:MAG: hypothetical protein MZV63_19565 [Marinilabiliales bacterium]|nr:hypothetical protein [Marinilabiliales bacterium]
MASEGRGRLSMAARISDTGGHERIHLSLRRPSRLVAAALAIGMAAATLLPCTLRNLVLPPGTRASAPARTGPLAAYEQCVAEFRADPAGQRRPACRAYRLCGRAAASWELHRGDRRALPDRGRLSGCAFLNALYLGVASELSGSPSTSARLLDRRGYQAQPRRAQWQRMVAPRDRRGAAGAGQRSPLAGVPLGAREQHPSHGRGDPRRHRRPACAAERWIACRRGRVRSLLRGRRMRERSGEAARVLRPVAQARQPPEVADRDAGEAPGHRGDEHGFLSGASQLFFEVLSPPRGFNPAGGDLFQNGAACRPCRPSGA